MSLDKIEVNNSCIIKKMNFSAYKLKKAFRLGLTNGTIVTVKNVSQLGSPIKLFVRNFFLAIRIEDAKNIYVEIIK